MAKPNAVVGRIQRLDIPPHTLAAAPGIPAPPTVVHLQNGTQGELDRHDPRAPVWGEILHDLHAENLPVYLEIDPRSNRINEFLIPRLVHVVDIAAQPVGDRLEVELQVSCAVHHLRTSNPDYASLLGALRDAERDGSPVLVTETLDDHEIIDVRPATGPFEGRSAVAPSAPTGLVSASAAHGCTGQTVLTEAQAQQIFQLVTAVACAPLTPAPPCIPFLYPDDGCWVRAHEMSRLMLPTLTPCKIWSYGKLRAASRNHPQCSVSWVYHVAPIVQVATQAGTETQVIDPSLFDQPVARETWAAAQQDPALTLVETDATVYFRSSKGQLSFDPNNVNTNQELVIFRSRLRQRSVSASGPPPYANCP